MILTPAAFLSTAHALGLSGAERAAQLWANRPELGQLSNQDAEDLRCFWEYQARPAQLAPVGDWVIWLVKSGRGFGKTRLGAEWVRQQALEVEFIHIVGETAADVRDVMVEGESGILAISPKDFKPLYEPSKRRLTWPNGCIANLFSGDEPDQLRGPQCEKAWVDELAKMRYAQETWDNLELGLRLGKHPQAVVTTTPRPIPIIRALMQDPECIVTGGSLYDNMVNLAASFRRRVQRKYEGTRLGRQELHGEVLDEIEGALWSLKQLETLRVNTLPEQMHRVVVALDPSVTDPNKPELSEEPDEWGIMVACTDRPDKDRTKGFVLEDLSGLYSPTEALHRAIEAFTTWEADIVVGEVNNGGDLIEGLLRTVPGGGNIPYKAVRASRGKIKRAEPIAGVYEQARIHHVGSFAQLEDEMTTYTGAPGERSPNRMDAMVWGFTELLLDGIEGGSVPLTGL